MTLAAKLQGNSVQLALKKISFILMAQLENRHISEYKRMECQITAMQPLGLGPNIKK